MSGPVGARGDSTANEKEILAKLQEIREGEWSILCKGVIENERVWEFNHVCFS